MNCRHCRVAEATRPRGLCASCYYLPAVRVQYESLSKYGRRGMGNFNGQASLPAFPTQAFPGTSEKIAVLAERVRLKQNLWHPDDATENNPAPPVPKAG